MPVGSWQGERSLRLACSLLLLLLCFAGRVDPLARSGEPDRECCLCHRPFMDYIFISCSEASVLKNKCKVLGLF